VLLFELEPSGVVREIRDVSQAVRKSQREKHRRVASHRHPGLTFSILRSVMRLIEARSAASCTGIRRRRRASRMSIPSLRRTRRTGIGSATDARLVLILEAIFEDVKRLNINNRGRYQSPSPRIFDAPFAASESCGTPEAPCCRDVAVQNDDM
jgi:hypothetical protein